MPIMMPIVWHPKRWWDFCMSEDEKKEIEPIFTEGLQYTIWGIETFWDNKTHTYFSLSKCVNTRDKNMTHGAKCFNNPILYTTDGTYFL